MESIPRINMKKTGANIRLLRKYTGLRIIDISQALHVYENSVYRWQTGTSLPNIDNLVLLADLFKCRIDDLLVIERDN